MINANSTYNSVDSTSITADNYSISCYLVGTGNRDLNNPLNWSSTSGGTPADVLGSELIGALDLNNWTNVNIVSKTQTSFTTNSSGGLLKSLVVVGKKYKCTIEGTTTVSNFRVMSGGAITNYYSKFGSGTISVIFYFTAATDNYIYLRNSEAGTTTITLFTLEEVLSVPNSSNPAIIDANSSIANGNVLSLSAQFDCAGFDCSAAAYTFTLSNAAYAFNLYGDLKDSTKRTNGFSSTGYLYFKGSSNIYSNGATQGWNRIYFDGVGATFTNQDDWNVANSFYILNANGTWNCNNKNTTTTGRFDTPATAFVINAGSGIFKIRDWNASVIFNYQTSTVIVDVASTMTGNMTFYNLIIRGTSGNSTFYGKAIVHNTLTIEGVNSSNYRALICSNTIGTPRTITVNGSIVASNVDFRDITLAGTANRDLSAISGGSGDCGGNSGITFTPSQTQYFKHTSGACQWSDATKWMTSSGGSIQGRVPLPQDDPIFDENSFTGASTLLVNCPRIGRSLNMEGVNQAVTMTLNNAIDVYGDFILGNNVNYINAAGTSIFIQTTAYVNIFNNTFNANYIQIYKGELIMLSNLTANGGVNLNSNCKLTVNGFILTTKYISYASNSYVIFDIRDSTVILTQTDGNAVNFPAGWTILSENSIIILNPLSGANNISLTAGSRTFNKVIFSGSHTGNFIISGNNTFNELIIEKGRKVRITGGSTQTISPTGKLIADGTPTEQIQITSTNTTPFNLVYAGTGFHQVNYCNISYCNATADRFYAGKNSTNGGNNTGWIFRNYLSKYTTTIKRKLKLIN